MEQHKIQHWVGGVPANAEMDAWNEAGGMLDKASAATIHYYRLTESSLSVYEQDILNWMLQSIRVYDLMWTNLKREENV
jgi:hypothetical protein